MASASERPRLRSRPAGGPGPMLLAAVMLLCMSSPAHRDGADSGSHLTSRSFVDCRGGRHGQAVTADARVGRARSRIAVAADGVRITKLKKGEVYKGYVDNRLRALVSSKEYRAAVDMFIRMEEEGFLDKFLKRALEWSDDADFYQLALQEQAKGRSIVVRYLKGQWPRIWPEELAIDRLRAFEVVAGLLTRIEQSSIFDMAWTQIMPSMKRNDMNNKDVKEDEEVERRQMQTMRKKFRAKLFRSKLENTDLARQIKLACEGDEKSQQLAPKMMPFISRIFETYESKSEPPIARFFSWQPDNVEFYDNIPPVAVISIIIACSAIWGVGKYDNPLGEEWQKTKGMDMENIVWDRSQPAPQVDMDKALKTLEKEEGLADQSDLFPPRSAKELP
eukprot:TRINITY_DN89160_c0_g1_i1.p1 TRINITY_DN89160_c0_g1~~TRINITY_DN89160_c0_g1_i1.p1  ORF type:complete len:391 (+),score=76.07 TRINITY_DN89160_c0_g1_i1:31-1203(+)